VVSRDELATVISQNPYPDEPEPRYVHVMFLRAEPDAALRGKITSMSQAAAAAGAGDEITARGRALYLHTPGGFGTSDLAKNMAKAKPDGTARNWATTTRLLALADG
jgi:uncharacterized protein (DUF1697 family)